MATRRWSHPHSSQKTKNFPKQTGFGEMIGTDVNQSRATGTNCYLHVTRPSISHRRENRQSWAKTWSTTKNESSSYLSLRFKLMVTTISVMHIEKKRSNSDNMIELVAKWETLFLKCNNAGCEHLDIVLCFELLEPTRRDERETQLFPLDKIIKLVRTKENYSSK